MKNSKLPILIAAVVVALVFTTIFSAIKASAEGEVLISLENKANMLTEVNQELKNKIVQGSSLSEINKVAGNMGMAKPENIVYMTNGQIALGMK